MTHWGVPLTALPTTSVSTGPAVLGSVIDLAEIRDVHVLQVTITNFTGSGVMGAAVQGSLDGVNWYSTPEVANIPGGASGNGVYFNQGGGAVAPAVSIPARFLQALAVVVSGSPTADVEITIASGTS